MDQICTDGLDGAAFQATKNHNGVPQSDQQGDNDPYAGSGSLALLSPIESKKKGGHGSTPPSNVAGTAVMAVGQLAGVGLAADLLTKDGHRPITRKELVDIASKMGDGRYTCIRTPETMDGP